MQNLAQKLVGFSILLLLFITLAFFMDVPISADTLTVSAIYSLAIGFVLSIITIIQKPASWKSQINTPMGILTSICIASFFSPIWSVAVIICLLVSVCFKMTVLKAFEK